MTRDEYDEPRRSVDELLAEEELSTGTGTARCISVPREPADIAAEHAAELEAKYGKDTLWIANDYDLGVLHGRLLAIRWALGGDHDNLDS